MSMEPAAGESQTALAGTAGSHATAEIPLATADVPAGQVRRSLHGSRYDSLADVAVLDEGRLVGLVPLEGLMAAPGETPLAQLLDSDPVVLAPDVDQEHVAALMARHAERSVAVVDAEGRFHGLIPPHRMLKVALAEHDEDVARLGGFLASTEQARHAAEEPVGRRLWHRLPWLLLGLAGAMASAAIVGSFEEQLAKTVLLAFFLPGVVYMADAVGTQTEALVIRGIAVGVHLPTVFRRELATGGVMGLVIGAAFLPFAWLVWDDGGVAVAAAIALLAACSTATVIAIALPYALHRLGHDPAFGSGPLATVVQDLLSIVIYFGVALAVVG
jgi:magnesium transporter